MRARFGPFTLDTGARELRKGAQPVAVSASGLALLALLIAKRPQVLTQAELRDALWPESHVGYTSLARVVSEVRKALGESAESAGLVRTVPRYGYAFAGQAVVEADTEDGTSRYVLVADDRDYVLRTGELLVGRGPECGLRLVSSGVSRIHARLQVGREGARLHDQGSKNGTWVNGVRVAGEVDLHEGDEVLIGTYRMVFRASASLESTRTATPR
jgi:DNA-binding winged helix-turn-helix (wHTH) protein